MIRKDHHLFILYTFVILLFNFVPLINKILIPYVLDSIEVVEPFQYFNLDTMKCQNLIDRDPSVGLCMDVCRHACMHYLLGSGVVLI